MTTPTPDNERKAYWFCNNTFRCELCDENVKATEKFFKHREYGMICSCCKEEEACDSCRHKFVRLDNWFEGESLYRGMQCVKCGLTPKKEIK